LDGGENHPVALGFVQVAVSLPPWFHNLAIIVNHLPIISDHASAVLTDDERL